MLLPINKWINGTWRDTSMKSAIKVWDCGFILRKEKNKEKCGKWWWKKKTVWKIWLFLSLTWEEGDIHWNKKAEDPKQINEIPSNKIQN